MFPLSLMSISKSKVQKIKIDTCFGCLTKKDTTNTKLQKGIKTIFNFYPTDTDSLGCPVQLVTYSRMYYIYYIKFKLKI